MIVLGIDTATPGLSTALVGPDGAMACLELDAGRRHTEVLAPAIQQLVRTTGISLADVGAIAADVGPGLFTGLRVGLATAAALSSALGCPAVGLSSTEVLAEPHRRAGRRVVAVVDVRRSEVAWACHGGAGHDVAEPALATPEELRDTLAGLLSEPGADELLVVGDGALRYRELLAAVGDDRLVLDVASPYPSAAVAASLARRRLVAGEAPVAVVPRYLRQADVRIGWERRDQPAERPAGTGLR